MALIAAARAVAVLALVLYVPGWAVGRALGMRADHFSRVWLSLAATSVVGLALARAGAFSLPALLGGLGLLSLLVLAPAWMRRSRAMAAESRPSAAGPHANAGVRAVACIAGFLTVAWCWPPFETVLAGSDSTMYLSAGIHLAHSGALAVADTVASLLPPAVGRRIFPSVTHVGWGPFIRLPGGLLTNDLASGRAFPAFFPLLPVWVGVLAATGGVAMTPAIAPLTAGLSVWATALFAGEALAAGTGAAMAAAALLASNMALWWFGRFAMPETLALAFIWGGLVFLGRAARSAAGERYANALAAGAMFGVAGLARTETFFFVVAAGALWYAWTRPSVPPLPLAIGLGAMIALAAAIQTGVPSHHLGYLFNDAAYLVWRAAPGVIAAWRGGRFTAGAALLVAFTVLVGFAGRWAAIGFWRSVLRVVLSLGVAAGVVFYLRLGGSPGPMRQIRWLADYSSWALLALALVGGVVLWRRGGDAGRCATLLWLLVAATFVLNPRAAAYHPWVMRRFLPVVIPGLAVAAAAGLVSMGASRWRAGGWLQPLGVVVLALLQLPPILAVRDRPYYAGSFAKVADLADRLPRDAVVAIDSRFADAQIQVPLWLVAGRETVMMSGGTPRWRAILALLVQNGRAVYWIGDRQEPAPSVRGLTFRALDPDVELTLPVPDSPPTRVVTRVLPLRIYGVAADAGVGTGEGVFRSSATEMP